MLLQRGADPRAEGGQPVDGFLGEPQTPLILARKRGDTPVTRALAGAAGEGSEPAGRSGGRERSVTSGPAVEVSEDTLAAALARAVAPLQRSADISRANFLRHATRQDCVSCHQQQLPASAVGLARSRGIPVDEAALRRQLDLLVRDAGLSREIDLQSVFHPEPVIGASYSLMAFRNSGREVGGVVDGYLHHYASVQSPDGSWHRNMPRPPLQTSDVAATALGVYGLRHFEVPAEREAQRERIERARRWLLSAIPRTGEELSYRLLGLRWAGAESRDVQAAVEALRADQREDGGWAQLPGLGSDAYATGHALYALMEGGGVSASDSGVRRGLAFLLQTQLSDGTWHVKRRTFPFQPPMESGFPHGADSWISAAGSSWAVMAMSVALEPVLAGTFRRVPALTTTGAVQPAATAQAGGRSADAEVAQVELAVDFDRDLQPVLDRSCKGCHSGERPKGGFSTESAAEVMRGGHRGEPVVKPGLPEESLLVQVMQDRIPDLEMPPLTQRSKYPALTPSELSKLKAWIRRGAPLAGKVAAAR